MPKLLWILCAIAVFCSCNKKDIEDIERNNIFDEVVEAPDDLYRIENIQFNDVGQYYETFFEVVINWNLLNVHPSPPNNFVILIEDLGYVRVNKATEKHIVRRFFTKGTNYCTWIRFSSSKLIKGDCIQVPD